MKSKTIAWCSVLSFLACAELASALWPFGGKKDTPTVVKGSAPTGAGPAAAPAAGKGAAAPLSTARLPMGEGLITTNDGQRFLLRAHMRFPDDASEREFVQFVASRRRVQEDLVVLRRLAQEKETEIANFDEQLLDSFGVTANGNYQYDADSGVISLLVPKPGVTNLAPGTAVSADQFDRKEHRKLGDEEQRDQFVRMVATKQLSRDQRQVLELLFKEKQIELSLLQNTMNGKYATSNDRNYRYDAETRTLFELVPVPEANQALRPMTKEARKP